MKYTDIHPGMMGKFYLMTKHREETWIIYVQEVESKKLVVSAISPGKKQLVSDWTVDLVNRVFEDANSEQVRHLQVCRQLGHYRSKPKASSASGNSYEIW